MCSVLKYSILLLCTASNKRLRNEECIDLIRETILSLRHSLPDCKSARMSISCRAYGCKRRGIKRQ